MPCGHLLGKGWPNGSRLWCLTVTFHFPIGILSQVMYLIVSILVFCTLTLKQIVLRGCRCLFMEEGSFYINGAAYPGSGTAMDKGGIPRDFFGILLNFMNVFIHCNLRTSA